MKWFIPSKTAKKGLFTRVFDPGSVVLGLLGKVFGETFVTDLVDFFDTLSFLQDALRTRGEMIDFILRDPQTRFVLITSADSRRIKEALFFHEKLKSLDQHAEAFVLNRVIPRFDQEDLDLSTIEALGALLEDDNVEGLPESLRANYARLTKLSEHNRGIIDNLARQVGSDRLFTIPMFGEDVHDLGTLEMLGRHLTE